MTTPPLCVVMPVHNGARFIQEALDSLFCQTTDDFEILVVDDGSEDDSPALVERIIAARQGNPRLRLLRQDRGGPSSARNLGIARTDAALVGFLDADDRWSPDKAAKHIALMQERPDIALSFSGFRFVAEDGRDLHEPMVPAQSALSHAKLLERNVIHTSTVIARRDALLAEGGFDETLRTYEDFDLWLKVASRSPDTVVAICEVLCDYRRHSGQATRDWQAMHAGWRRVVDDQKARAPEIWESVRPIAEGNQYEYCAALAYNAGDIPAARRLILACWRAGGASMAARREVLLVSAICLATYLPRPLQVVLGSAYAGSRRLKAGTSQLLTRLSNSVTGTERG